MIYLASPYSHQSATVMERRFDLVMGAAASLLRNGNIIYSPIIHFHPLSVAHDLPGDFDFWKNINFHMLTKADELWVLMLDGWEDSIGVAGEIAFAEKKFIKVTYVRPSECGVHAS